MQKSQTSSRHSPGLSFFVFALFLGYSLGLTAFISARRMFWADEILGWYIISDRSWHHAMQSWNTAMDSGGQLYDLISWCLTRVTGYHEHFLRYMGSLYILSAAALWWSVLRRFYGTWVPVFAIALTWFCSAEVMFHFAEFRFYSLYLFAATLCVFTAVKVEECQLSPWLAALLSIVSGTLLIGTHLLGFGWVALILIAQVLLRRWTAAKLVSIAGFCASTLVLIPARALFKLAAHPEGWWIQRPTAAGVFRYYLHLISMGGVGVRASLLMSIVAVVILVGAFRLVSSGRNINPAERLLLCILVLFTAMPIGFYIVSQVRTPIFAERYLEPVYLGIAGLFACACHELWPSRSWKLHPGRARFTIASVSLAILCFHAITIRGLLARYESFRDLDAFAVIPGTQPVLFQDVVGEENLHIYRPESASRYFLIIPRGKTALSHGWEPAKQGYWPFAIEEDRFFADHARFLYLSNYWSRSVGLDRELLQSDHWEATPIAPIALYNGKVQETVYQMIRR